MLTLKQEKKKKREQLLSKQVFLKGKALKI